MNQNLKVNQTISVKMKNRNTIRDLLSREQKNRLQQIVLQDKTPICTKFNFKIDVHYYRVKSCHNCKHVEYEDRR